MIYVEKIIIENNSYPGSHVLKQGFEIECTDVTLFVGDQGSGKSTLLNLIKDSHPDIYLKLTEYTQKKGVSFYFFDTEKNNPRISDPALYTDMSGRNVGIGYGQALASRFKSHGEVLQEFTVRAILSAKNSILIIDEPESGLSITNQFKLIQSIKTATNNGCQFFIATHCFPLIKEFDVISLDSFKKMKGNDFIKEKINQLN